MFTGILMRRINDKTKKKKLQEIEIWRKWLIFMGIIGNTAKGHTKRVYHSLISIDHHHHPKFQRTIDRYESTIYLNILVFYVVSYTWEAWSNENTRYLV